MKYRVVLSLLVCCFIAPVVAAQSYQPRANYGQRLEPMDKILHGAGQDPNAFRHYWDVMDEEEKPLVYMHYENLSGIGTGWARTLRDRLRPYQDRMIVIQLGLELVGLEGAILAGLHDDDIEDWLDGIEDLGLPVYARLGYEFNGLSWNGYLPQSYKAVFIYLTEKIRARNLDIATVWNYVPDPTQPTGFMDYYPGDAYVDWWSINIFDPSQITNRLTEAYLDSAAVHNRPVLIGESTPKDVGVLDGQADWDAWFAPFFALIASEPGLKATGYINWDWSQYPQWSTWGDARLQENEVVRQHFSDQLDDPIYLHAGSEKAYRTALGFTESDPPVPVANLTVSDAASPITLSWDAATDASGIARYWIYESGERLGFTGKTTFALTDVDPGETLTLTVTAVDRAGNESLPSDPVAVSIPAGANMVLNNEFDADKAFWTLQFFAAGVAGTFDIDPTGRLSGPNSAHITITQNTGTNFHIQLEQPLVVEEGHAYAISYQARASTNTEMETWLQKAVAPFTGYAQQTVALTTEAQTYRDTAHVTQDDDVLIRFMFGTSGLAEIWIDSVSVVDLNATTATATEDRGETPDAFDLSAPYPNPFRTITHLTYRLPQAGTVRLQVFDMLGRLVTTLAEGQQAAGPHTATWQAESIRSGAYFIRLSYAGRIAGKMVFLAR